MIRAIAAIDDKLGIAAEGHPPYDIPWDIPIEVQRFKELTMGGIVVMGRRTYGTLTNPLPGRRNIVVSHNLSAVREGFELVTDIEDFLNTAAGDVWIIGGAEMYAAVLHRCDELYLTQVRGNYRCDRFFPNFEGRFKLIDESPEQEQNGYRFTYATYTRI
nr:Dihydrofolate reductase [uncultured bacterium]